MKTVRELMEGQYKNTEIDIFEVRNVKPTGIFYYNIEDLLKAFGSRYVEDTLVIKGIRGNDAVLRFFLKKREVKN